MNGWIEDQVKAVIGGENLAIAQTVIDIAEEVGKLPAQVALNWIRHQSDGIIPIIGSRKLQQIQENIASLEFDLTPEQLKRLDDISSIELGFPHDFLKSDRVQNFAFGGVIKQLDLRVR
ncbi:aldo/keto reductase [Leptolyngbya sp. NIES-3755]|nr:aldo/keto reductase [Leptolyngbya sp. NIES-3755]